MSENASETAVASEQAYFETQGEAPLSESESTEAENAEQQGEQPQGEQAQESEAPEKPQKTVPLAALHEARAKEREAKQRIEQLERNFAEGNARLNQLMQALQQPQQPQIPDRDTDPVNHFAAVQAMQQRQIEQQNQFIAQQQAERAQQAHIQQLQHIVSTQEQEFSAQKPDYFDAVAHLRDVDVRALMVAGGYDQATATQIAQQHFMQLADALARQGANLPERVYAIAQAKGYAPKAPETNQRLDVAKKGVAASRSLGNGAGTTNNLTLETLASMPAEDFAEATKDPRVFRRLMGG